MGSSLFGDRFEIVRTLARSGTSEVFEARDRGRQRVAVKLLRGALATNAELVSRFQREARAAASLTSPHVVRVLEVGTTETNRPFLVMEYLAGRDLATEISVRGALPLQEAAGYLAQACRGIIEAHDAGIVHRDLKPTNLYLAEERGRTIVKVLDFGIAKLQRGGCDAHVTDARALFGSPLYMSPEMFRGAKSADARSDVWSLGVIFYEMLTGAAPFEGATAMEVGSSVTRSAHVPPSQRRAGLPRSVDAVIARALRKEPPARYQSARELLAAIELFLCTDLEISRASRHDLGGAPDADPEGVPTRSYPPDPGAHDRVTARPPASSDGGVAAETERASSDPALVETSHGFGLARESVPPRPSVVRRRSRSAYVAAPLVAACVVVGGWTLARRHEAPATAVVVASAASAAPPLEQRPRPAPEVAPPQTTEPEAAEPSAKEEPKGTSPSSKRSAPPRPATPKQKKRPRFSPTKI